MNVGDRVEVKAVPGVGPFKGSHGVIMCSGLPDYEWFVAVDGMSIDEEDTYGFNEAELSIIKGDKACQSN